MDWNDAKVFSAVAASGSLSAASRQLGMSQPTVGRHIEALEQALNNRLFDRGPRGYSLTAAGQDLLPHIYDMERAAKAVMDHRGNSAEELSGTVRLSVPQVTSVFISQFLREFRDSYPEIELELESKNDFVNMSRREADIALRTELPKAGDLRVKHAYKVGIGIFGSREYIQTHPEALTEERYRVCDWVALHREVSPTSIDWLTARLGDNRPKIRCSSTQNIHQAVAAGAGLCMGTVEYLRYNSQLQQVSDPIPDLTYNYWLVSHAESLGRQTRVRAVWNWLEALFKREMRNSR